jgi:glycosyltransferase involved in cell wall biosynthesis
MVIIEAFSLGLPVIAYDCYCGPSDIIKDDKGGYLIDFDDEEQFLKKLEFLMNNDDVRIMKSSEAQKISKSYYLEEIMPLWLSLFKNISS